jgi:hypothetical protein
LGSFNKNYPLVQKIATVGVDWARTLGHQVFEEKCRSIAKNARWMHYFQNLGKSNVRFAFYSQFYI